MASSSTDGLNICPQGCLVTKQDRYCPWHGERTKPLVGHTIGELRIGNHLSSGGFGAVYRGSFQNELDVAIKILKPPYCYVASYVQNFLDEATQTKDIVCPNVPLFTGIFRRPWPHITMEFIPGDSLSQRLKRILSPTPADGSARDMADRRESQRPRGRRRPPVIPVRESLDYLMGAARALAEAHRRQIFHRDLKPSNVMVSEKAATAERPRDEWAKVIDWGIAVKLARQHRETSQLSTQSGPRKPTELVGTPEYMAYECFECEYSPQTDVYAFGVTAFESLAGVRPCHGHEPPIDQRGNPEEWKRMLLNHPNPPLSAFCRGVPRGLRALIARCLSLKPQNRFRDGGELLAALKKLKEQLDWRRRLQRMTAVAAGLLLVTLSLVFAFFIAREKDKSPPTVSLFYLEVEEAELFQSPDDPSRVYLLPKDYSLRIHATDFPRGFDQSSLRVLTIGNALQPLQKQPTKKVDKNESLEQPGIFNPRKYTVEGIYKPEGISTIQSVIISDDGGTGITLPQTVNLKTGLNLEGWPFLQDGKLCWKEQTIGHVGESSVPRAPIADLSILQRTSTESIPATLPEDLWGKLGSGEIIYKIRNGLYQVPNGGKPEALLERDIKVTLLVSDDTERTFTWESAVNQTTEFQQAHKLICYSNEPPKTIHATPTRSRSVYFLPAWEQDTQPDSPWTLPLNTGPESAGPSPVGAPLPMKTFFSTFWEQRSNSTKSTSTGKLLTRDWTTHTVTVNVAYDPELPKVSSFTLNETELLTPSVLELSTNTTVLRLKLKATTRPDPKQIKFGGRKPMMQGLEDEALSCSCELDPDRLEWFDPARLRWLPMRLPGGPSILEGYARLRAELVDVFGNEKEHLITFVVQNLDSDSDGPKIEIEPQAGTFATIGKGSIKVELQGNSGSCVLTCSSPVGLKNFIIDDKSEDFGTAENYTAILNSLNSPSSVESRWFIAKKSLPSPLDVKAGGKVTREGTYTIKVTDLLGRGVLRAPTKVIVRDNRSDPEAIPWNGVDWVRLPPQPAANRNEEEETVVYITKDLVEPDFFRRLKEKLKNVPDSIAKFLVAAAEQQTTTETLSSFPFDPSELKSSHGVEGDIEQTLKRWIPSLQKLEAVSLTGVPDAKLGVRPLRPKEAEVADAVGKLRFQQEELSSEPDSYSSALAVESNKDKLVWAVFNRDSVNAPNAKFVPNGTPPLRRLKFQLAYTIGDGNPEFDNLFLKERKEQP